MRRCSGWMGSAVRVILKNPIYKGPVRWTTSCASSAMTFSRRRKPAMVHAQTARAFAETPSSASCSVVGVRGFGLFLQSPRGSACGDPDVCIRVQKRKSVSVLHQR